MEFQTDSPMTDDREDFGSSKDTLPPFFKETPLAIHENNLKDYILYKNIFMYPELPEFVFKNYLKVETIEDYAENPEDFESEDLEEILSNEAWFIPPLPEMQ